MRTTTHRIAFGIIVGLLLYLPLAVQAAFITDKIVVEVRTERFGQGTVIKKLPSGTSVEVLMTDGQYTRVRTPDNITGWVASTFLTNEKPTQLEYLELLAKSKTTEAKLREAEQKLAAGPTTTADSSGEDIELLKKQAQDARWMKVEMQKARDRAEQAEAKLKRKEKNTGDTQKELATLRTKNKELEQRLAAAILVNEQQEASLQESANTETTDNFPPPTLNTETAPQSEEWAVKVPWFLGSLLITLFVGFFAGFTWLDRRNRQRHGGFRI